MFPSCSAKETAVHLAVHPAAQIQTTEGICLLLPTIQIIKKICSSAMPCCIYISYFISLFFLPHHHHSINIFLFFFYFGVLSSSLSSSWLADTRNVHRPFALVYRPYQPEGDLLLSNVFIFVVVWCCADAVLYQYTVLHIVIIISYYYICLLHHSNNYILLFYSSSLLLLLNYLFIRLYISLL